MDLPDIARHALYPPVEPYRRGCLSVTGGHEIYYEECGNANGEPVLLVHGGPGGGSSPTMRRYHDPARTRIILFDQRGCGRSTPHAGLAHNTTWQLIEDMERLRALLGVERWQLFGGSWGSTLSLAYAQAHPERVTALILRGIFLARQAEIDWFYKDGANWLFPEAYEDFLRPIPRSERADIVRAYYQRLTGTDQTVRREAARAWSRWEGATLSLMPDGQRLQRFANDSYALAFARIECHYFVNHSFFEIDGQLLRDAYRLANIPGIIVQGRYDVVTPARSAFDLKAAWPRAALRLVADAGHAMTEPGTVHELIAATRQFAIDAKRRR